MQISDVCGKYFNGFHEAYNCKNNDATSNVLAALKIFSYFTLVIPLCFAVLYCASLCGRVCKKESLSPEDQTVSSKAKKILFSAIQPEIVSDGWGTITLKVNGEEKTFKDVIILPSDGDQIAKEWDWAWSSPSMRHKPGIREIDILNLILPEERTNSDVSHEARIKPDVIILSQGRGHGGQRDNRGPGILEVGPNVPTYIKNQGIEVHILKTAAAIDKYNELRNEGKKHIAALIHTTC